MKKVILSLAVFASVYSLQANNSISKPKIKTIDECMVCTNVASGSVCGVGANCALAYGAMKRALGQQ